MCDQIYKYVDQILSKYQCSFCRGYNTQYCTLVMVEKWKEVLDKGGLGGALLKDLFKAFYQAQSGRFLTCGLLFDPK